jgi:hypothetical protein
VLQFRFGADFARTEWHFAIVLPIAAATAAAATPAAARLTVTE